MDPTDLYGRIRDRLDLSDSNYLEDSEIGLICVESYFDLWDFLIDLLGDEAPWERVTLTTVPNQDFIDVPFSANVYRMLRLEFASASENYWLPVRSLNLASDTVNTNPRTWSDAGSFNYFARRSMRADAFSIASGTNFGFAAWRFYFSPVPSAAYNLRLYYIPPPAIQYEVTSGVEIDSFPDEFPEYVVADVCAKLADKQEADSAPFVTERERIKTRIERYAKPHQMNGPRRIADLRRLDRYGDIDFEGWRRRR